jgi:hypothetical protein
MLLSADLLSGSGSYTENVSGQSVAHGQYLSMWVLSIFVTALAKYGECRRRREKQFPLQMPPGCLISWLNCSGSSLRYSVLRVGVSTVAAPFFGENPA